MKYPSRFVYLVERLQRAGVRHAAARTDAEHDKARGWLVLRNRSVQLEYARNRKG